MSNRRSSERKGKSGGGGKPKYKLTYFEIRWLAEPIRHIFHYVGEDFEDVRISFEKWDTVKTGYPYPKLPVLEWEGNRLCQSFAIARYLGKQYNLVGSNDFESAKLDEYADVVKDVLKEVETLFSKEDKDEKEKIKENIMAKTLPALFTRVEADIGANGGKYLLGSKKYTWVDFLLAHYTELFESFVSPSFLKDFPNIKKHQIGVLNIPQIAEWIKKRPVTEY